MPEIRFHVDDESYALAVAYLVRKRRWAKIGHMARDALFQMMDRYPVPRGPKAGVAVLPDGLVGIPEILPGGEIRFGGDK